MRVNYRMANGTWRKAGPAASGAHFEISQRPIIINAKPSTW